VKRRTQTHDHLVAHGYRLTVHLAEAGIHSWSRVAVKLASKGVVVRGFHAEVSHDPGRSRVVVDVSSLGEERASWLCRDLGQLVDVVQADLESTNL
jgi:hypothetical protein